LSSKASSTMQLPRLERLLLDCDISHELEPLLQAVGFRPKFAQKMGLDGREDTDVLRWARRHRYILVCHDRHRDRRTQLSLFIEIRKNGGKIIEISGHTGQDPLTALGKLIVHRERWRQFFNDNHGIVTVYEDSVKLRDPHELYTTRVQKEMALGLDPAKTVRHRKTLKPSQKKRIKGKPLEQQQLI
jgi:hypothetical protein